MMIQRRKFLSSALAIGGAVMMSNVRAGENNSTSTRPANTSNLEKALAVPRQKTGQKITRIETFTRDTNLSFVVIHTNDGRTGIGQIAPFDADISATILHRKLAPWVLGADPADFEAINDRCIEANYKFPWSFICRALAGIDTAIWDWLGKKHDKNICSLLGGTQTSLPVYGSSMRRDIQPAQEAERLKRLQGEQGFAAFKIRVGKKTGHDQDEWPGRTEALIPAVRAAVGPNVELLADANSCYTPRRAIEVGRILEAQGYCHYEEPCPYWELEWTAEVAAALNIPVAGGEQDNDLAQWRRMLRLNAVDIVQPDLCYIGGLTRALQVARWAADANKLCVPHSANLSWVTVFALHLCGAIPNAKHVEFGIEPNTWTKNVFAPALTVRAGRVAIPADPGWGVRLTDTWLRAAKRQVSDANQT